MADPSPASSAAVDAFIERWSGSGASERSNYQLFLSELCDVLGVDRPDPAGPDTTTHGYVFERRVDYRAGQDGERGFIDLYKQGCFVLDKQGLVGVLKELHGDLDAAVAAAYGWDPGLPEETILQRLVDLNAQRRAEEEEGQVRYLRPAYQAPEQAQTQAALDLDLDVGGDGAPAEPLAWPSALKDRAQAVRAVMHHADGPLTVEQVARHFHRARRSAVRELLDTLAALGQVEQTEEGAYAG